MKLKTINLPFSFLIRWLRCTLVQPATHRKPETKHTKTQRWNPTARIQTQIADDVERQSSETNLDGEWEERDRVYMRRQRHSLLYKTLIFKLKQKWITFQIFECNASDAPLSTNQHIQFTAWAPASKQSFNDDLLTVGIEKFMENDRREDRGAVNWEAI